MRVVGYLIVKVEIECPEGSDPEEVRETIGSEADYSVSYNEDGIRITNTEILGVSDSDLMV